VVKLGSAVIAPGGELSEAGVARLASDMASVAARGVEIVVVTSGAIASGFRALGLSAMPRTIVEKQAAAAVGQCRLMSAWADGFGAHGRAVGQVLLTGDDFDHPGRMHNARTTLLALLSRGVVPIINENDSVSFDEIRLGDNDRLSALVTGLVGAQALVILSTAPGVLEAGGSATSRVIPEFPGGVAEAFSHVRDGTSAVGTGGMATKLAAVGIAGDAGAMAVIAAGVEASPVSRVLAGEMLGTFFAPPARVKSTRRRYIGYAARTRGIIVIDDGARQALVERGSSVLPSGVLDVVGAFDARAIVEIRGRDGTTIARGVCAYAADEVRKIRGCRTTEIEKLLGYCYSEEVVHRDDLVVLPAARKGGTK
jgi:glutamate 5-kinase